MTGKKHNPKLIELKMIKSDGICEMCPNHFSNPYFICKFDKTTKCLCLKHLIPYIKDKPELIKKLKLKILLLDTSKKMKEILEDETNE